MTAIPSHLADDAALAELLALRVALCVVQRDLGNLLQRLVGEERLVRGEDDVGEGAEAGGDGVAEDLVLAVLVHVRVLALVHVEAGSADLARADAADEPSMSTRPPRAVLMRMTPSFILAMVSSFTR